MTTSGAYEDEMARFLRLDDEELSRLLAGEAATPEDALEAVASLLRDTRDEFASCTPDATTRERHLAAIVAAIPDARAEEVPADRPGERWRVVMNRTKILLARAAAAALAASTSMIGLAYAGVDLPGQAAERALEAVTGLELPNQGEGGANSVADEVLPVVGGDLEGCERGQAIADAADANRRDGGSNENEPCDQTEAQGSRGTGEEHATDGRARAAENSGGASGAGSEAAENGRATATEKSGGASDAGAGNAGTNDDSGRAAGDEAAATGKSKGDDAADTGSSDNKVTDRGSDDVSTEAQEKGSSTADDAAGDKRSEPSHP